MHDPEPPPLRRSRLQKPPKRPHPSGELSALHDKYIPGLNPPEDTQHDEPKLREADALWATIARASKAIFEGMTERKRVKLGLNDVFKIWARLEEETGMLRFSQRLHRLNHHLLACEQILGLYGGIPLSAERQSTQDMQILEQVVFPASEQLVRLHGHLLDAAGPRSGSPVQQQTNEGVLSQIRSTTSNDYRGYHRFEDIMLRLVTVGPKLTAPLCVSEKIIVAQHELQDFSRLVLDYPRLAGAHASYQNHFIEVHLLPLERRS
ncbi:uncharacterized protein LAJ45_10696 [Morchella importuna]|uniref:uncharacterized protein n=1 Tax=Morchella importuna TaxID=1174673 RepID=UPI001E8CFE2E|nr:uncharacterized protein LAJ45_10696 [Morchella importuna]KAH8145259.1 hypothetical protein LAJ45_10696 [Morchella importuna]